MSQDQDSKWCRGCDVRVLAVRPGVNHILHLIISLTTCGAWTLVWLLLSTFRGRWRCSRCGLNV